MYKLTILQAYNAMQFFLENYYTKTQSDDLGSLLSGMQLFSEGETFDPAMWGEWLRGLEPNKDITILDAFEAMRKFLEDYYSYIESDDIKILLDLLRPSKEGSFDRIVWSQWLNAIQQTL